MKQIFIALTFLISFAAEAQTALDSNTISFSVKYNTAMLVRQLVPITEIQTAIASATIGTTDTSAKVSVSITEAQLLAVYRTISGLPIALGRPIADELMVTLSLLLQSAPQACRIRLITSIQAMDNGYTSQRGLLIQQGANANKKLQDAINSN